MPNNNEIDPEQIEGFYCPSCDYATEESDLSQIYLDGEVVNEMCPDCVDHNMDEGNIYWDDMDEIYKEVKDQVINNYGYKPEPKFHMLKNGKISNNTSSYALRKIKGRVQAFFGFEIETDCPEDENRNLIGNQYLTKQKELETIETYLKEDGTCSGFEIVSHPFTFEAFKKADFSGLKLLKRNGMTSYNGKSCGIHVHISRTAFEGQYHIYKFQRFFFYNPSFIAWISQRNPNELRDWATLSPSSNGVIRKNPWTDKDEILTNLTDFTRVRGGARSCAVNMNNSQTVEVRIFRGTLFEPSFRKNVEFCDMVLELTRNHNAKSLNPSTFESYLEKRKGQYPNLWKWCQARGAFQETENPFISFQKEYQDIRTQNRDFITLQRKVRGINQEINKLKEKIESKMDKKFAQTEQGYLLLSNWKQDIKELQKNLDLQNEEKKKKEFPFPISANDFFIERDGGLTKNKMNQLINRSL